VLQLLWEDPVDLTSVFAWFAQESVSIAEQANEPERRETFTQLALLWATAAQQCSGGAPAMQSSMMEGGQGWISVMDSHS
jgi:hypothetical protein